MRADAFTACSRASTPVWLLCQTEFEVTVDWGGLVELRVGVGLVDGITDNDGDENLW